MLDLMFPDIGFVAPDRYPVFTPEVVNVQDRLRLGLPVSEATKPTGIANEMAASNMLADRDEAFNTRLGSMRGWQMAIERVLPIPRRTARIDLVGQLTKAGVETAADVIAHWESRFFHVRLSPEVRRNLIDALTDELGTEDVVAAASYRQHRSKSFYYQFRFPPWVPAVGP